MSFRSLFGLTVSALLSLTLAACGGGGGSSEPTTFAIGGTVTGLAAGQQVTLTNNGANALTVNANGSFTFTTRIAENGSYLVAVTGQPVGQTCTVSGGSGSGVVANITNVTLTCSTSTFTIGGSITGLAAGEQVTLLNNGADALTRTTNGAFTFSTPVAFNGSYAVTVGTQPTGKTCTRSNGSGSGVVANIINVTITCSATTFTIGGTVTGLAAGEQVTLLNNGADALIRTTNGAFTFSTPVAFNGSYAVTVGTQPSAAKTCTRSNAAGSGVVANINTVTITCSANTFTIGGSITGLAAGEQVTLLNNGADALTRTTNGAFTFSTPVAFNGSYDVTVGTQPSAAKTCTRSNGTGNNVSANINTVTIICSPTTFTIGGSITGLVTGQQVTLLNNGADALTRTTNGAFTFSTPVTINSSYNVTVDTHPTALGCRVFSGSGSPVTANVTSVNVTCRTEVAYVVNNTSATVSQYTIGDGGLLVTLGSPVSTGLDPRAMAVDPTGNYAYVPNHGDGTVSQYKILADGSLVANGPAVPTGSGAGSLPTFVAIDPTGRYVYVTNSADTDKTVSQFRISTTVGTEGQLVAMSTPTIPTIGGVPLFIAIDPSGKFAYVANAGSQSVAQYRIDGASGALSALTPATVSIGSPTSVPLSEPFGITIHPSGSYAYVGDYAGNAIFQFNIDGSTGSLSLTPGAPTVTAPFVAGPYPMVIDSTGQYALWSNTLATPAPTLSQCTIGAGGFLNNCTSNIPAPGREARYISIDPTGRFAYVANHGDNTVSQYRIGSQAVLIAIDPATAGTGFNPWFVTTTWTR